MEMPCVALGDLAVSRFILGANPFSGFSHQSAARDAEMRTWYNDERIIETLFQAQALGLTACVCRGDEHIARVLERYWAEGGTLLWVAQTDSRAESPVEGARFCLDHGASACFVHGGVVDHLIAHQCTAELEAFADFLRGAHVPAGIAGHMPEDFLWAEQHLELDFYMVCYYNPSPRQDTPYHDPAQAERYLPEDREARVAAIQHLTRPVIHYKILAAGRLDPAEAFAYAARHMRPGDAVCVGVYTRDNPNMLAADAQFLLRRLQELGQ